VRFHRLGQTSQGMVGNEQKMLDRMDYACHDQRCSGCPYPLRAARDRATLTSPERMTLRKQIVEAGLLAGSKRSLFRESGHDLQRLGG
jgi:hypothetical protein